MPFKSDSVLIPVAIVFGTTDVFVSFMYINLAGLPSTLFAT